MDQPTLNPFRKGALFKPVLYFFYIRFYIVWGKIAAFYHAIKTYYKTPKLLVVHLSVLLYYLGFSAYRIHRKYMHAINEADGDAYGDTPLKVLIELAQKLELKPQDHCLDLGCGVGMVGFTWNLLYGCKYTGVDINPLFVLRASKIARWFALNTHFSCKDMRKVNPADYNIIYLYGTYYSDLMIKDIYHMLIQLHVGAKIVTISYSLSAWDHQNMFRIQESCTLKFPWGWAQVFISEKIR